jgi:hypothetical protein
MRISSSRGEQKKFIEKVISKISVAEAAKVCNLSERTIRDWRREKFLMQKDAMLKLCKSAGVSMPLGFKEKDDYWHINDNLKMGKNLGAIACIKKYGKIGGFPEERKKKWRKWWDTKGKYQKVGCIKGPLPIKIPHSSKDLAEFAGIISGDGGITKNQVSISTNSIDDRKYGFFIKRIIKRLFNVEPSIYFINNRKVMIISVSRKKLVKFCDKKLGIKAENKLKQKLNIPDWIKKNSKFEGRYVRGLIDTDGCIFDEIHNIKGKKYHYKRLNFTSASPELIKSVFNILKKNNLFPKIKNNRVVQIENKQKIEEYFRVIGTSNPKHLKRYLK